MKEVETPLRRCQFCNQINDPLDGDDWENGERFREEHGDDQRVIFAIYDEVDFCPDCRQTFHTDEDFGSSWEGDLESDEPVGP